ncbi:uncharacterized protein LOC120265265 [Dioscorea cayenensis subsp. rotundata]|uniref:Uncharacterized protein LOC120265265 n=1 Tax=Dioscorea cayennensis subsp. rotundata TaxID=55577 RepID=A0AB40BS62_DIOCR|nr:uncharacterized protein LOC120265265 [Dioscorea cayenensis subsp. rotundata]
MTKAIVIYACVWEWEAVGSGLTSHHYMVLVVYENQYPIPNSNPIDPSSFSFVSHLIASCGPLAGEGPRRRQEAHVQEQSSTPRATTSKPSAILTPCLAFFASLMAHQGLRSPKLCRIPLPPSCSPSSNLKPKVEFYLGAGFSSSDLRKLFGSDTQLLLSSLKTRIIPPFNFLEEPFFTLIRISSPPSSTLPCLGVPERRISELAKFHADVLLRKNREVSENDGEGHRDGSLGQLIIHSLLPFGASLRSALLLGRQRWQLSRALLPEDEILLAFKKQPLMMTVS